MTEEQINTNNIFKSIIHDLREGTITDETINFLHQRTIGSEQQAFNVKDIDWLNAYYIYIIYFTLYKYMTLVTLLY